MAHRLVVLLLLCIPSTAYTLGLGDLQKRSQLNERFYATVPIINAKAEELDALTVKLADVERFRRAGLERPASLSQLRFEVVETRDGPDYIKITSTEPIREPFINFLIEVNWSKGRLFREYAALLDPPAYKGRSSLPPTRPATARREPPRGAIVRDKSTTPPWRTERRAAGGAGDSYGPTVSGDTLWEIAVSVRTDPSASVQQIMFALLRANPDAFFLDNNMNALKRGAVLQLPEPGDSARMSQREAMQVVSKHSALWERYRQRVAASAQPQPAGEVSSAGAAGAPAAAAGPTADEAQLKLLAAEAGAPSLAPGNVDKGLAIAQETMASQKQEIGELNSKLTEADEIIKLLRKQIEIKDADLAALQAKAAGAPVTPETATPSDRAAPETAAPPPANAGASPETSAGGSGTTPEVTEPSASATPDAAAPSQPTSEETPPAAPPDAESSAPPESSLPPAIPTETTKPESEVAAPLPPPTPEAPATPDGGGLTDNLLGGNLGLIGGVAALVVIVIGVAMVLKKRGTSDDSDRPVAEDFEPVGLLPASPEDSGGGTFRMRQAPASAAAQDGQSAASPASEVIAESNIEDPLSDLDVYLTYERFEEAERLVNQAIAADPNQLDYKLKLLEVYHASGNKAAFATSAKELRDATVGQGSLWERATAMWQALSPDQPLLADEPAAASVDVEESEFMDIGVAEQPRRPGDTVADIGVTEQPRSGTGFDLGITRWLDAAPTGTGIDGSAVAAASNSEIIDVTSPSAQDREATEFIDITAPEGGAESVEDTVRVVKLTEDVSDEMTRPISPVVVDITSPGETEPEATHELPGERTLSSWLKEPPAKKDAPKRSPMDDTLANFDTRTAAVDGDDGIEFDLSDFPFEKIEEIKPVISGKTNLTLDAEPSAPPEKDADPLDIMDLSAEFGLSPEDTSDLYKAINKAETEQSGIEDEADTTADVDVKLNLAKAYIELGDAEGARSILEEVVQHGVEEQRQEATQLLQQLG